MARHSSPGICSIQDPFQFSSTRGSSTSGKPKLRINFGVFLIWSYGPEPRAQKPRQQEFWGWYHRWLRFCFKIGIPGQDHKCSSTAPLVKLLISPAHNAAMQWPNRNNILQPSTAQRRIPMSLWHICIPRISSIEISSPPMCCSPPTQTVPCEQANIAGLCIFFIYSQSMIHS